MMGDRELDDTSIAHYEGRMGDRLSAVQSMCNYEQIY